LPDKSEQAYARAKKVLPGGVDSPVRYYPPYPFFAEHARGSKITTVDHLTYVDYCMGYGALLLGHGYTAVINAVKKQLEAGTLYCVPTEAEITLAELICKVVPCAEMARIVNTGAEATQNAIRLARAYTHKKKVIKFDGGYHGAYDYVLGHAGSGAANIASQDGILEEAAAFTITLPFNDTEALKEAIQQHGNDVCSVIIEPVPANIGLILPEKGFLNDVRKITAQNEIVLIFDEVVTGFRLAVGGASEFLGVKPDLATFAKALGNGFPIGAIAGKKEIMQQLAPSGKVYQASTFAGNPISVAAAIASLQSLITGKNTIYPRIARRCDDISNSLRDSVQESGLDCTVNSIGSMYQLFFTKEKVRDEASAKRASAEKFRRLFDLLLAQEIFIPPSQFESCFVSFAHTEDDIDKTSEAYANALQTIKADKK
jgi:glutamate-1-semialdehyde 2,1-aminomutase